MLTRNFSTRDDIAVGADEVTKFVRLVYQWVLAEGEHQPCVWPPAERYLLLPLLSMDGLWRVVELARGGHREER